MLNHMPLKIASMLCAGLILLSGCIPPEPENRLYTALVDLNLTKEQDLTFSEIFGETFEAICIGSPPQNGHACGHPIDDSWYIEEWDAGEFTHIYEFHTNNIYYYRIHIASIVTRIENNFLKQKCFKPNDKIHVSEFVYKNTIEEIDPEAKTQRFKIKFPEIGTTTCLNDA
ncbi:hypothetical protein [Woodsholea maritima]|uniref:hypothetical protein n=1 Tax=Woodsholea maritima TaxID=240237 RepID=UPI0012EA39DA|nr:hypothetical protein [Woodsholea maritima]